MRRSPLFLLGLLFCAFSIFKAAAAARPPNIVFILADDLGYGDIGPFGQKKILTPNLDRLAAGGMKLTRHYSGNAVCAPSRCVLLTGKHPGHAAIRDNRELKPEGQTPLPAGTITLPRLLQKKGYVTGAFGKWGLGGPGSSGDPLPQGFDRFFGYNCQRLAHNYYPTSLWSNTRRVPLNNSDFAAHQKFPPGLDLKNEENFRPYRSSDYAPDRIADAALEFLEQNRAKPFFLYFPSTIPHLALQVPEDSLAAYRGRFSETPYDGSRSYLPHATPRAAYAAMVSRLDRDVGRLMKKVAELNLESKTIFIFTSDNGPLFGELGGTDTDFFGSAGKFHGRKGSLYEGGVRVPCLIQWKGTIEPGSSSDRMTGFEDWLPTLLELIRVPIPKDLQIDGLSFAPTLLGQSQKPRPFLYREFPAYGGQFAIWSGEWKLVGQNWKPGPKTQDQPGTVELFQLTRDPGESSDLAAEYPKEVARLQKMVQQQHQTSAEFPFPYLDQK